MGTRSPFKYFNITNTIEKLIRETSAVSTVSSERISALRALAEEAKDLRKAALKYESTRTYSSSTTVTLTSKPSGLGPIPIKAVTYSLESADSSTVCGKSTSGYHDPSKPSDSGDFDASDIGEAARAGEFCINNWQNAYVQIAETLVMILRHWLMELEDAKYKPIDFDAPLKRWTRKEKIIYRTKIREMSYEIRKKHVLDKMTELNRRRTSMGQTQETKLAIELIELLLQDMFTMRIMPFKVGVFPIFINNIYDWEAVSEAINGTHSPAECQEAWFTKFHPNLYSKAWSKAENQLLSFLADAYNLQHWDQIAKQMGTHRSGFQCYVQYRRCLFKDKQVLKLSRQPEAKGQKKA